MRGKESVTNLLSSTSKMIEIERDVFECAIRYLGKVAITAESDLVDLES